MRAADHFYALATGHGHALRPPEPLPWLTTQGHAAIAGRIPGEAYDAIRAIFELLDGDERALRAKSMRPVLPDFMLDDDLVEFDEEQHFTIQRLATLALYPSSAAIGFDRARYARLCLYGAKRAEKAFAHKMAIEFPGAESRARQRAYFDAFRDLASPHFGSGPVIRIAAPNRDPEKALAIFELALAARE